MELEDPPANLGVAPAFNAPASGSNLGHNPRRSASMAHDVHDPIEEALAAYADPEQAARRAGLCYVSDEEPGIRRKRWGRGFTYLDPAGDHITGDDERARLDALAIPPAWTDVWICPSPDGHLLATGRDEKGRKQYLYHPDWQQVRSRAKFTRLVRFGQALSQLRARCEHDLRRKGLPRDKVLAAVVTLLGRTLIRVGNPAYARENGSYGLTTLRDRHVDFAGQTCTLSFKGKSGKRHQVELDDPRLARLVRRCRDVTGYHLFQYYDEEGERCRVGSGDVNAYLKETTSEDFTAKDFRTWGGTVHAAVTLAAMAPYETPREADQNVVRMVKAVAERLGNTTAVCRDYYIHPAVTEAYLDGTLQEMWPRYLRRKPVPQLEPEENALLCFLKDRLLE
jgi:DNA topoisomerase-1